MVVINEPDDDEDDDDDDYQKAHSKQDAITKQKTHNEASGFEEHTKGRHDGRGMRFFRILFRRRGSVVPHTLPVALSAAFVAAALVVISRTNVLPDRFMPTLRHPVSIQMLAIVLGYIVILRTTVAMERYFEGITNVKTFAGKWTDAFSFICAFIRTSAKMHHTLGTASEKCPELRLLQFKLLHWWSLMHGLAVNMLQVTQLDMEEDEYFTRMKVEPLPVHDINELISVATHRFDSVVQTTASVPKKVGKQRLVSCFHEGSSSLSRLQRLSEQSDKSAVDEDYTENEDGNGEIPLEPLKLLGALTPQERAALEGAEDKVDLVHSWIVEAISTANLEKVLLTQPQFLTRVFQELSNGMLGFNQAYKIALVQFPFAFAQMLTVFLVAFFLATPFAVFVFTGGEILTPFLTLFVVLGFWGIHESAVEVENPYGMDENQLPLVELHNSLCETLAEVATLDLPHSKCNWQRREASSNQWKPCMAQLEASNTQ